MPLNKSLKKVLVIGSGPIVIGQAAEFDYAGTQACMALKEEGIEVILINNNPATIMTDETVADKVYMEPLTVASIEQIIIKEKPDGLIGTLGGQTALNLTVELHDQRILQHHRVQLLGSSVESIQNGEDREKFRRLMIQINEPIPESKIIHHFDEGVQFVDEIGYPVIIRPAYTLGGDGGGFAYNDVDLEIFLKRGLSASPIQQVLIERSIKGWKEIEYEVMRDENDTCVIVCNMENMDPVGVHTGDSVVVAPSQTLTDVQYHILRDASIKVIRELEIIGGCNIQFALNPSSNQYCVIEVNPRVSRSSALASKATGYPIARMAAKCAIGYHLDELINPITGNTFAAFEPAIDYIVVKLPRFPFDKFPEADRTLGTQMKATGEVMSIDRTFEGALNKAIRSLEMNVFAFTTGPLSKVEDKDLLNQLEQATDLRLFAIGEAIVRNVTLLEIQKLTQIDPWFLQKIKSIIQLEKELADYEWERVPKRLLKEAKLKNISDHFLSKIYQIPQLTIRKEWKQLNWKPSYKMVDTCSAEFDAITPYYYSTWQGVDEVERTNKKKIVVIGSGPIRIGQGIEFDYCSVQATIAIKKKGYEAIVINNNPETVSTDYAIADRLYFEPLALEDVLNVIEKEHVDGVFIQFGGQTAINLAAGLAEAGVPLLGTDPKSMNQLEDRQVFYDLLNKLDIPHIEGETVVHSNQLIEAADRIGYPVLVRPSYVIGGQAMFIFHQKEELLHYHQTINEKTTPQMWPLLVDRYIAGLECEMDVISDGVDIVVPGIFEHIEKAGVHSGDSTTIFPPISLSEKIKDTLLDYAERMAKDLPIIGMMNIQYVVDDAKVYVLEVNPRSSRTVPIMSKITSIPMVEWATEVQLGRSLKELHDQMGLLPEPPYFSIKTPVFSSSKLKGVDHVLGPEMKSTGEILGMGLTPVEAMKNAFIDGKNPFKKTDETKVIFCSIADREKEQSLATIKKLVQKQFKIVGTEGTVRFLLNNGINAEKAGGNIQQIKTFFKNKNMAAVINLPTEGRKNEKIGFQIRELALQYKVPCFTSLETVKMMNSHESLNKTNQIVRSISEYAQMTKISIK
jgi:carbamoyl-phosphate synthase large subunit